MLPVSAGPGVVGDPPQLLPAVKLSVAAAAVVVSGIVADPGQRKNARVPILYGDLRNHLKLRNMVDVNFFDIFFITVAVTVDFMMS